MKGFKNGIQFGICLLLAFATMGLLIASAEAGSLTLIHQDHLGSASLMTDSEGNNPERRTYYPFGAIEKESVIGHEPNAYNDKDLDAKTKLYNFEARMYAAQKMHFTTPDIVIPDPANGQSWNRYAYVRNNPMKYVDPSGHSELSSQVQQNIQSLLNYQQTLSPGETKDFYSEYLPTTISITGGEDHIVLETGIRVGGVYAAKGGEKAFSAAIDKWQEAFNDAGVPIVLKRRKMGLGFADPRVHFGPRLSFDERQALEASNTTSIDFSEMETIPYKKQSLKTAHAVNAFSSLAFGAFISPDVSPKATLSFGNGVAFDSDTNIGGNMDALKFIHGAMMDVLDPQGEFQKNGKGRLSGTLTETQASELTTLFNDDLGRQGWVLPGGKFEAGTPWKFHEDHGRVGQIGLDEINRSLRGLFMRFDLPQEE